jgi:hypothetical protein
MCLRHPWYFATRAFPPAPVPCHFTFVHVHARVQFCFWLAHADAQNNDPDKNKDTDNNNHTDTDTETDTESQTENLFKLLTERMHVPEKFIGLEILGIFAKVLRQRLKPARIQLAHLVCSGI